MSTKSELKYHIVWCTKYRRKVLTDEMQNRLKEILKEVCDKNNFKIEALETMQDHVYIFVQASPKDSVHRIVSQLKGLSSYRLREEFKELTTRLPCLWTRSYHSGTVGHVSEETVKKYIENQKNV